MDAPTETSWPVLRDHWMADAKRKCTGRSLPEQVEGRFMVAFLPALFAIMEHERDRAHGGDRSVAFTPLAVASAFGLCLAILLPHMTEPHNREAITTRLLDLIRTHVRQKGGECQLIIEGLTGGVE